MKILTCLVATLLCLSAELSPGIAGIKNADDSSPTKTGFFQTTQAISYSGYRRDQYPDRGDGKPGKYPSDAEILQDLNILAPNFKLIRMYDAGPNTERTLQLIESSGIDIKVVVGAWLFAEISNHEACPWLTEPIPEDVLQQNRTVRNPEQIANAIRLAKRYPNIVAAVNVGNEILASWTDHKVSPEATMAYIRQVQAAITQPVTVAETADAVIAHPEAAETQDFLMLHTYPIWVGADIDTGFTRTVNDIEAVRNTYPDKQVVVGEAGWATTAIEFGERASQEKQRQYFSQLMDYGRRQDITIFFFEAFDEPWKGDPDQPLGAEKHWGLYTVDRLPKLVVQELN